MTPLEFLTAVLPTAGNGTYCLAELSSTRKEHKFGETLEDLIPNVQRWLSAKRDIYFALASFEEAGKRTADNAKYLKSFFIDMDGYESKKAAAQALNAFLAETALDTLGTPWIVASGGGLHCYWPLTAEVDVTTWKPVAENFKRLCKQEKMAIDMTVTADAARVLRVPDTYNYKPKYPEPRPVRLLAAGDVFDFEAFAEIVRNKLVAPTHEVKANVIDLPGHRPAAAGATSVKLFENSSTRFKNILNATKEGKGCGQLAAYIENAEDDGMEPLWRGLLSIAQKCEDGNKAAIWLSQQHPYPPERMHQKLREIKGPYPCVKFDSENPGVCTSCKHWGNITNPLALGRELKLDTSEKVIELPPRQEEGIQSAPNTVLRPQPPRGYSYGDRGGVFVERVLEDAEGGKSKKNIMLLPYDMFVVDILNTHGEHAVHLLAMRPEGPQDLILPQKSVVSKDETVKALANQNILATYGAGNDKNLFEYVRACVEDASHSRRARVVPDSYGWQGSTYVFAGRIFQKHQLPVAMPMPGLDNLNSCTEPKGNIDNWRQFVNLLVAKRMYKHLAILLAGAGAPLMRYTKLAGMTYHCASTESGTGKSLALEAAASVWGHPVRYRVGKSTSPVAMQQRLGLLHCHPLITDELTSKNRENFEWLPEFLLDMSQGKGKERMEAGANKERLNLSVWYTNALLSSNTHIVDVLTGGRKHAAEGELRRIIEFVMEDELSWEPHEVEIIKSLSDNYGVVAPLIIQYMIDNEQHLQKLVTDIVAKMYKEFDATNDERFWMAGIGASIAMGVLWSGKHAGIIDLPLREIIGAYKGAIKYMRDAMRSSVRSAEDVLNAYTGDNYGKFVVVRRSDGSLLAELGDGRAIDQTITRTSIAGRIEHDLAPGYVDYFIEEALLKAYCATMSFGYKAFVQKLKDTPGFSVSTMKKNMTSKTRGPQMRVSALVVRRRAEDVDTSAPEISLAAA